MGVERGGGKGPRAPHRLGRVDGRPRVAQRAVLLEVRVHVARGCELEEEVDARRVVERAEEPHDEGVRQRLHRLALRDDLLGEALARHARLRDHLERVQSVCRLLAREHHRAEAARAELAEHLEVVDLEAFHHRARELGARGLVRRGARASGGGEAALHRRGRSVLNPVCVLLRHHLDRQVGSRRGRGRRGVSLRPVRAHSGGRRSRGYKAPRRHSRGLCLSLRAFVFALARGSSERASP